VDYENNTLKMKKNDKYLLVFYALLVVGISVGLLYMDSSLEKPIGPLRIVPNPLSDITVIKVVDVETEKIFTIMSDIENYPNVLPGNVLSVNKLEETNSSLNYEITVMEQGIKTTLLVKHDLFPYDEQILTIIEGDAKNTTIHQKFQNQGNSTKLITDVKIELSGLLTPFQFIPQHNFSNAIGTVISAFFVYSLEKSQNVKIVDDLYREILKRPADQEALFYFTTLLEKNEITPEEIKTALYDSEEYNLPIKDLDELTDETKKTIDELYEITLRRGADETATKYFGSLLEHEKFTELDIITELLKSSEYKTLSVETRWLDGISKENMDIIITTYFETTGRDASKNMFVSPASGSLMSADKLFYALAVFLESKTLTIDEIKNILLNNPDMWEADIDTYEWYHWSCEEIAPLLDITCED